MAVLYHGDQRSIVHPVMGYPKEHNAVNRSKEASVIFPLGLGK